MDNKNIENYKKMEKKVWWNKFLGFDKWSESKVKKSGQTNTTPY